MGTSTDHTGVDLSAGARCAVTLPRTVLKRPANAHRAEILLKRRSHTSAAFAEASAHSW